MLEERTPPSPLRSSFGAWKAPAKPTGLSSLVVDRGKFAGLSLDESARLISRLYGERKLGLRPKTLDHVWKAFRAILKAFAERGKDLATVTAEDCAEYRAWLADQVERGVYKRNYAANTISAWNKVARAVFGEEGRPGEGLVMRTFGMVPKVIQHLTQEEMDRIVKATTPDLFLNEHNAKAFKTWLEVAWSTGARVGSILHGSLKVGDIDWDNLTLRLRHVKNKPEHIVVLTPRAALALREWVEHLRATRLWKGPETPVFLNSLGVALRHEWANDRLHVVAAKAKVTKSVTTHAIRKAVGTIIGKTNPKFAKLQLGITDKIFERHYNQPLLEDRLERRDLLPGADWKPTTPEEVAGAALLAYSAGKLTRDQFEDAVAKARDLTATPTKKTVEEPSGYV